MSEVDYPERAIRAGVEGSVVAVIAVDPTGAATGCTPIEIDALRFGLEDATCRVWTERARFSPARNASGVAIPGTYRAELNWALAEPEPEPPASTIVSSDPVPEDIDANACISFRQGDSRLNFSYTNSCNQPLSLKVCVRYSSAGCTAESWYTTPIPAYGTVDLVAGDGAINVVHHACTASEEHVWYEADAYFDLPARYICSPR
ncbi:hypothetical protein GVN24_35060 [Rhizobium sp. CRIBSB]|nr:hypothetical protein [Rhizobium sp. CRIBSB]